MDTLLFEALIDLGSLPDIYKVSKCVAFLRVLLSRGVNVNVKNSEGNSLLHLAVSNNQVEIVKFLIESGVDVRSKNNSNKTALNLAFDGENPIAKNAIMNILFKAGADVNTISEESNNEYRGMTALYVAAKTGDAELAQILIDRGADVNAIDSRHRTPLHWAAARCNSEDPTIFEVLLSANADVNAQDHRGQTPLYVLFLWGDKIPSYNKIVEVFLKHGADLNMRARSYTTPLDIAIHHSNKKAVEALVLCGGVSVDSLYQASEAKGQTILHAACCNNDLPTIKFLLKNGANIDALDSNNVSPLLCAKDWVTWHRDGDEITKMKTLKYLLEWRNPDVNAITTDGSNILTSNQFGFPNFLWQTIVLHMAKLEANENPICDSLLNTISENKEFNDYFKKCKQELALAKNSLLHAESYVTFFDLLVVDKKKLVQYAGNSDILNNFNAVSKVFEKFPIYGTLMNKRFLKAVTSRFMLNEAAKKLSDVLPVNVEPDHNAVWKILGFFSSKDLRKLCQ